MSGATDLSRPLAPGTPFGYWRVSDIAEERYDLPDAPMQGEMDPVFFLTRDRNFIPHEYPCRTALRRRPPRPPPRGPRRRRPSPRNWLPFGAPRLDLSGFWFRPTRLAAWARDRVVADAAGTARFRLATCGGAVLFVNGARGRLDRRPTPATAKRAPSSPPRCPPARTSSWSSSTTSPSATPASTSSSTGSTARRPAPALPVRRATPTPWPRSRPRSTRMHFERPAYADGEVALVLPAPLPPRARVTVAIDGDFMSPRRARPSTRLAAGAAACTLGRAEALPADFRHFAVTLDAGGFAAARVLGVEIARARQPRAPATPADRIAEALATVAAQGEPDTVTRARPARHRPRRRRDRGDDRRRPRPDRRLLGLRRLRPGAAALGPRIRYADLAPDAAARADRPHRPRLPLLDRRARQRRAVVLLREPRAALPHRRLSRRPPAARRPLRPLRPHRRRAVRRRPRPRARLARPLRALGDGRVQLRPLLPDRPQGPDRALRARPRRRHPRPRRPRHRPAPRDRRQLRPPRHPDRRAGPLLRALALRAAARSSSPPSPACSGARGGYRRPLPRACRSSRSACATTASRCPDLAARALWTGDGAQEWCFRQGEDGFAAPLPLQDPRLRHGLRRRATAGANGATRRRCSTPASAPSRRRRSGSTTPAR